MQLEFFLEKRERVHLEATLVKILSFVYLTYGKKTLRICLLCLVTLLVTLLDQSRRKNVCSTIKFSFKRCVFKNSSDTLIAFLERIKLNCCSCTFSIEYWLFSIIRILRIAWMRCVCLHFLYHLNMKGSRGFFPDRIVAFRARVSLFENSFNLLY